MCDSLAQTRETAQIYGSRILIAPPTSTYKGIIHNQCTCGVTRSVVVAIYINIWARVTSSDIIPYGILRYNTMEHRCGQYSVTNCWCDVGLLVRCFRLWSSKIDVLTFEDQSVDFRRSMCRPSKIDVSTFEDRWSMCRPSKMDDGCVNLRRSMMDVSTFEDRWLMCRLSKIDDRCEIMLLHSLKTSIL